VGIEELFKELGKRVLESDYSNKRINNDNKEIKIEEEEREKGVKLTKETEKTKKKKKWC
jgi:hypothetical protein